MSGPGAQTSDVVSFGRFELRAAERLLTRDGAPVELGARALDILIALASRPNEAIGKRELIALVWPDVIVDEGSLRFHVARLRRELGDGRDGARYIATLAGRGYCFVAPIARSNDRLGGRAAATPHVPQANLPPRLVRMVGRADDALALFDRLTAARFVTIVGTGGVGKTTLAVAVGHALVEAFAGAVVFVDLGALSDPALAATTIGSLIGLSVQSNDPLPSLIAYMRDKRMLLILDTCEHLVEAVAALAARIFADAPHIHILATSREALRAEGEHVLQLAPLACPPDDATLTASCIHAYPAAELFLERAAAGGARLDLGDAQAATVAAICRKLDGVALALELAAGRVAAHGLAQTAALLDQQLALLWPGQRTAPPRQRSLQAALDWSYGLLSEAERTVLRQLAVFAGHFTIEAALDVVASRALDRTAMFAAFDSLVAKSIVAVRPVGAMMRYRLLDTTRAYAMRVQVADLEIAGLATRHATYYRRWLDQTGSGWLTLSSPAERALHLAGLNNVRAALEWCFGPGGDLRAGVDLAVAAAPVLLSMSLLPEVQRWSERALSALERAARGGLEEMHLQAALGVSLMFTRGGSASACAAVRRSLAIAEERGAVLDQVQLLGPLNMFYLRSGDFSAALDCACRCSQIAATAQDPVSLGFAGAILGISLHLGGDLDGAGAALEAALRSGGPGSHTTTVYLGFEGKHLAGAILARNLWLRGRVADAAARARATVQDAERLNHPLTLSIVLIWTITVFLWIGELHTAERYLDRLSSITESHSLRPHFLVGEGFRGELAIRRGDARSGVEQLGAVLAELHRTPYELLTTPFHLVLAQGLGDTGRVPEAVALVDEAIRQVEVNGDACYMPELLRIKGCLLLIEPGLREDQAESCFARSLEMSRRQGARAWELRTAIDWASRLIGRGRRDRARVLLQPICEQFAEDPEWVDLATARRLLENSSRFGNPRRSEVSRSAIGFRSAPPRGGDSS